MFKVKNLSGKKFGRLTVIELAGRKKDGHAIWKCECECGKECLVASNCLQSGNTKSCGCFATEVTIARSVKHEMRNNRVYHIWIGMKQRCLNPFDPSYSRYGERGITIYEEWINDFLAFYNYVANLPHFGEKGYSLDRIDNNKGYVPDNLRWSTSKAQCRNRRTNFFVEYDGKKMTLAEAAELSGIKYITLWSRYSRGWRGEDLFKPVKQANPAYQPFDSTKLQSWR